MKRVPRLLCASLVWGAAAGGAAMLGLACSSFSGTADEPAPAPAPDAALADAEGVDAPAPEASSNDAMPDAAPSFCAIAQADAGGHVFCADFEDDDLTTAWRPLKDPAAWTVQNQGDLSLVDGTMLSPPRTKFLQVLTGMSDLDASVDPVSGGLIFVSPAKKGFHIEFDMNADSIPSGGVTPFDIVLTPTVGTVKTRIYLTLTPMGAALVVATDAQSPLTYKLAPGFPTLDGSWRHLVLDIGGTASSLRMTDDGFPVVNTLLGSAVTFEASAKLRIGAPYYLGGPIRMFWDDVTLDELP